jgi:hypothetical protein
MSLSLPLMDSFSEKNLSVRVKNQEVRNYRKAEKHRILRFIIVPRERGVRGAATARSGPRHPSASNRAGYRRRPRIIFASS